MNNTDEFLQKLNNNTKELLEVDFYKNLRAFEHIIKERSIALIFEVNQFLKSLPNYVLDIVDAEDSVVSMFANSHEQNGARVYTIDALDEEEMSVYIYFNNTGKVTEVLFFNDRVQLTLSSKQDLVVYERNGLCLKLVKLFKDYYSLNVGKSRESIFNTVATYEKEKVDRDVICAKMLLG